jgi:histone acetyltransferase SAS3
MELRHIQSQPPKPKKKKRAASAARSSTAVSNFVAATYSQPFYSLHDREMDELKAKPYGGILKEKEADTSMTLPTPEHRRQFDDARQKAEEEWKARVAAAAEAASIGFEEGSEGIWSSKPDRVYRVWQASNRHLVCCALSRRIQS